MEIQVRDLILGKGRPKICVPLCGRNIVEIQQEITELEHATYDIVEWRMDFCDKNDLVTYVYNIRQRLGNIPLLATCRTYNEGGNAQVDDETYFQINQKILDTHCIDCIDVEAYRDPCIVEQLTEYAHDLGVKVIMSYHDFYKTPKYDEIIARLSFMEEKHADICKIAVMPRCSEDVLTLLQATNDASQKLHCPLVTMSMSQLGLISRLSGEIFGSCLTFGCVAKASAPGQISSNQLKEILDVIHSR